MPKLCVCVCVCVCAQDMLDVTLEAAKRRTKSKALLSGTKTGKVGLYYWYKDFNELHIFANHCVFQSQVENVHRKYISRGKCCTVLYGNFLMAHPSSTGFMFSTR